jgi:hypothetical protein
MLMASVLSIFLLNALRLLFFKDAVVEFGSVDDEAEIEDDVELEFRYTRRGLITGTSGEGRSAPLLDA